MVKREVEESHSFSLHASTLYYSTLLLVLRLIHLLLLSRPLRLLSCRRKEWVLIMPLGLGYVSIIKSAEIRLGYSLGHVSVLVADRRNGVIDASTFVASHSGSRVGHQNVERSEPGLL
jgi:hypothetical protein